MKFYIKFTIESEWLELIYRAETVEEAIIKFKKTQLKIKVLRFIVF